MARRPPTSFATTVPGSTWPTPTSSSSPSAVCMRPPISSARVSDWRPSNASSSVTAGASGRTAYWSRARPSTSPCRRREYRGSALLSLLFEHHTARLPMIVLNLACSKGHRFEGWFASADAFDDQQGRGLVTCPFCNDDHVSRLPSGPHVVTSPSGSKEIESPP